MIAQVLAALFATGALSESQASSQPQISTPESERAVQLDDLEVTGRRMDSLIRSFVDEVAAPNAGRGIARWDGSICVGVANLRGDAAHYIVDRVSTVAEDVGLKPGTPGCSPNLMIIATDDGGTLAAHMVDSHKRALVWGEPEWIGAAPPCVVSRKQTGRSDGGKSACPSTLKPANGQSVCRASVRPHAPVQWITRRQSARSQLQD